MHLSRWILILAVVSGCAGAKPVEQKETDEQVQARLDAEHRQAQADYDRAKAAEQASKPK